MALVPPPNLAEIRAAYAALRATLPDGCLLCLSLDPREPDSDPWVVLDYLPKPGDGGNPKPAMAAVAGMSIASMVAVLARIGQLLDLPDIPIDFGLPIDFRDLWVNYEAGRPASFQPIRHMLDPTMVAWVFHLLQLLVHQYQDDPGQG